MHLLLPLFDYDIYNFNSCFLFLLLLQNLDEDIQSCLRRKYKKLKELEKKCRTLRESEDLSLNLVDILHNKNRYLNQFSIDFKLGLAFCKVPKAACTSFSRILLKLHGYNDTFIEEKEDLHQLLSNITDHISKVSTTIWQNSAFVKFPKILQIRHPFERLLSGYIDKIKTPISQSLPENVQIYMRNMRRNILKMTICKTTNSSRCLRAHKNKISFPVFVDAILQGYEDVHFLPFSRMCFPCAVPYTHIIRAETFTEDIQCLLKELDFPQVEQNSVYGEWFLKHYSGNRTDRQLDYFYLQLTNNQIRRLFKYYYLDHILFGYPFLDYFESSEEYL